ncbi:MAG: hypothetical protein ACR2HD_08835 [Solirubrobacteraceae bacterium]|nr:MAG: hypothetical protein DLM63_08030 [Solirubrobacterales bacterium]
MDIRRASSAVARAPGVIAVPLLWGALRVAYGPGYAHYDAIYSLIWGRDLIHARLPPDFADVHSPTEHPLANVLAAPLSLLHFGALRMLDVLSLLAFALLGWLAFRLGRALLSVAAGVLFAVLLLTCPPLVMETLMGSIDIPFLVLIMWATVLEAERPRRGWPVLAVLMACGLLRPEAWLLAAAYWLWLVFTGPGLARATQLRYGAMVLVAPLLWMLFDLVSAHDLLISLTGTQRAGRQTKAAHSLGAAIVHGPHTLASILGTGVSVLGIAGALVALALARRRLALPLALLGLGLLGFLALGAVGLPVIARYAFVPSLMVAFFCAYAVFGWLSVADGESVAPALRLVWMVGAPLLLVALVATNVRYYTKRLPTLRSQSAQIATNDGHLNQLLGEPGVRTLIATCGAPQVRDFRTKPLVAYLLGGHARDYVQLLRVGSPPGPGVYLEERPQAGLFTPRGEAPVPASFHTIRRVPHFTLYADCPAAAGGA